MHITCFQAPSTQPSQSKPHPKANKGPKKLLLVSQLLKVAVPPMVPDWGPLPSIGSLLFGHPMLDEENNPFFTQPLTNGRNTFIDDNTTDPLVPSPPSPPFAPPSIDPPLPSCVDTTAVLPPSHAVIPHLHLWKPPTKHKLSS
ncbi:hypothetical protein K439DRAFT_1624557 [Ramaria rubella]|nr:hypothetical protein K439DRAFT_1624557 [Ramaria rubella]